MEYFLDKELECKCGCGLTISKELRDKLNKARERSNGVKFIITSGARCKNHNTRIGGVSDSAHIYGLAVDIAYYNSQQSFYIIKSLLDVGFQRIGINFEKSFIHCDIDNSKPTPCLFKY